jgi:multidrug efflux pump subunit AcrB
VSAGKDKLVLHVVQVVLRVRPNACRWESVRFRAFVIAIQPPSVRGMGNAGGFQLEIEDRRNAGLNALQQATDAITAAANAEPGLSGVFTTYHSHVPQLFLNIDREKVQTLNVPISSVFTTLQSYLGSNYVNDFNHFALLLVR